MRKVLSFVLVLSLVLGSFSMAFAASPAGLSDIDGIANEDAIQVAFDLGIVTGNPDGTFLPEKAVTRAEFAAMITRALAIPDSALAGYTATTFKDTAGYGWAVPYLAFAQSKGIMLGDGAGNVMPGRTINSNEAITMALRAIGYTNNSSELVGVWPANYVTKAQDLGVYDDVASATSVDKANAAQIIYNLLTVSKVQVAADGTTTAVVPATNLLTSGLKASTDEDIVYYDESSVINIAPYVGAYATKYLNEDDEIIAVKEKSTFLTGKINSDGKFEVDDVDYTLSNSVPSTTTTGLVNNDETGLTYAAFNVTNFGPATYTIAADVTGKTIKTVYTANRWIVTQDEMADDGVQDEIADNKLLNYDFAENDDDTIDMNSFALVGVSSLDKIAEDNVVYVYTLGNGASADIVKVSVGTEIVEGVVTAFNDDDGAKINGKYYEVANPAATAITDDNVSDTVKAWLTSSGKIYDFEITDDSSADNYAVVTGATRLSAYDTIIKLINKEASEKTYTVDSDVAAKATTAAVGQIVVFGLDDDGVLDAIDVTTAAVRDSHLTVATGLTVETSKVAKNGSNSYRIASDVVVFTYEGSSPATATDWDTSTIDKVTDDPITSATALYFDEDGVVAAMLVPEDAADSSADDLYGVVNSTELTVNADNDQVYQIDGWANGADLNKLSSTKAKGELINHADNVIQLYKFGVSADGAINDVVKVGAYYWNGTVVTNTATTVTSGTGILVASAGDGYITNATAGALAIADNANYYQVTFDDGDVDEYTVFSGTVREGYKVWLFETDSDEAGYDIVVVLK